MRYVPFDRKKAKMNFGCLAVFVLFAALYSVSALSHGIAGTSTEQIRAVDACSMAQTFVKKQLKAPATARFAPCRQPDTVVTKTGQLWHVRSYVDAQNGFGAMLRNEYNASLSYHPASQSWTLVDLHMD